MLALFSAAATIVPGRFTAVHSLHQSHRPCIMMSQFAFDEQQVMADCLLLPQEQHAGTPHIDLVGEVQLQELEDDQETRTQLFFNENGTITHGATDGPPPAGFCGLWQAGADQFQMTLSRVRNHRAPHCTRMHDLRHRMNLSAH